LSTSHCNENQQNCTVSCAGKWEAGTDRRLQTALAPESKITAFTNNNQSLGKYKFKLTVDLTDFKPKGYE
jgi:hypothetical protein